MSNKIRVTIVIDEEIYNRLQRIRGEQIKKEAKSISFSKIINVYLSKGLGEETK